MSSRLHMELFANVLRLCFNALESAVIQPPSADTEQMYLFNKNDKHSSLFQNTRPTVAVFLNTDQPGLLGYYFKTCFTHRQSVLTS